MAKMGAFKSYQRGQRIQLSEERFEGGMSFTNTPLQEGINKLLINYDYKDNGEALIPRSSSRVKELALQAQYKVSATNYIDWADSMMVAAGKDCITEHNQQYKQLIVGRPTTTKINNGNLYKGLLNIVTVYSENDTYEEANAIPPQIPDLDEVAVREMHITASVDSALFRKPLAASIHGIPLASTDAIAKQVGCFAYNNQYYFFKCAGDNSRKLMKTALVQRGTSGKYRYETAEVTPRVMTAKEATMWGYNMLAANPYTFANNNSAGGIQFLGLLPYDVNGNLLMSPQVNQTVKLRMNYSVVDEGKYTVEWEWKEMASSVWTIFKSETRVFSDLSNLEAEFSSPGKDIIVRVSAYGWTGEVVDSVVAQVLAVGFNFDKDKYGSSANVSPETYDLSTATSMCYWKGHLVLAGLQKNPTMLFISELNDPSYFPFPNNVELFDEPIIHVTAFLDNLLVFTASQLHILTWNMDGLTWNKKMLQGNLNIQEWDLHLIQVVKNMVFFKSGNYFYMVVPKAASTTGELTIAPIAKPIENLLDNFKANIDSITRVLYDYSKSVELVHYYNFLDFEDIYNVYVFKTEDGLYMNICLLYNITQRSWRAHTYESQTIMTPYQQDATKKGILVNLVPVDQRYKEGDTILHLTMPGIEFLQFDYASCKDFYIPANIKFWPAMVHTGAEGPVTEPAEFSDVVHTFEALHWIKNWQLLDTGYREHNSDFKKRYREVQMKLNNVSLRRLDFYTDFNIDGEERISLYNYETRHELDPENPNYGLLHVVATLKDPTILPGITILGDAEEPEDTSCWALDISGFPEIYIWKIRLQVSGKGYAPRMRCITRNEEKYELLNVSWIYRSLYSR